MESNLRHQVKVGLFITAGIALFCTSVILLGGDQLFLKKTYELKVRLPQVQGLGRGSVVSLLGVHIGNVREIEFVPLSPDVEVLIRVDHGVFHRITEGSKASVKTQGALGDKYIYIEPGPPDAAPLKAGSLVSTDSSPDFLDMIAGKGQTGLTEFTETLKEMRLLFASLNHEGNSKKVMSNLVRTTDSLNQFLSEGRETFRTFRSETMTPLSSVVKKIDKGQGTLGALINDPSLHNRISGFFGESPRNKFLKPLIRDSIQTSEGK